MNRWLAALAVYREPRVLVVFLLGFSSGLPLALSGQTLAVRLSESGVSLTAIGLLVSVGTPYALKFLWAPLIDRLTLPWLSRRFGRRRGWLLLTQVALIAAALGLGAVDPRAALGLTALLAFLVAFASASQDIVIDAYRVEILEQRQLAAGAAAVVFGYRVGMLVSGAGALYLASVLPWTMVYATMAGLVLVGVIAVLVSAEPALPASRDGQRREAAATAWLAARPHLSRRTGALLAWLWVAVVGPLAEFVSRPGWLPILLFVMLYKFGDSLAGAMTFPFFVDIGFSKVEIANVAKLYGFTATMAGLALGGWLMSAVGMYRALWLCGLLQMASNLMFAVQAQAGADVGLLAVTVGVENLAGGMGTAAFVAYLSSLCNVSYTATQYALLSSFMAVARTWLSSSSGALASAFGWAPFFVLTTAAAVPGLILLWWLSRRPSSVRANHDLG